jgi:GNAT superfamily N-acetyltransferase
MEAWSRVTAGAKQRLFNRHYGANYIQLQILGTLPQWQRKGAATALCSWGLQLAAILRFHVTVLASPMGKQLYTKLGFRKLAAVNVCAGQGDSGVTLTAMALEPRIIG